MVLLESFSWSEQFWFWIWSKPLFQACVQNTLTGGAVMYEGKLCWSPFTPFSIFRSNNLTCAECFERTHLNYVETVEKDWEKITQKVKQGWMNDWMDYWSYGGKYRVRERWLKEWCEGGKNLFEQWIDGPCKESGAMNAVLCPHKIIKWQKVK